MEQIEPAESRAWKGTTTRTERARIATRKSTNHRRHERMQLYWLFAAYLPWLFTHKNSDNDNTRNKVLTRIARSNVPTIELIHQPMTTTQQQQYTNDNSYTNDNQSKEGNTTKTTTLSGRGTTCTRTCVHEHVHTYTLENPVGQCRRRRCVVASLRRCVVASLRRCVVASLRRVVAGDDVVATVNMQKRLRCRC